MKKIMVLGLGAQGSTAARKLAAEPNVSEVICADYDERSVENVVRDLPKAKGAIVDASDKDSIVKAAQGVDLILAIMPLEFLPNAMEAALEVGACYQDYSGTTALAEVFEASEFYDPENEPKFEDPATTEWYHSICALHKIYGPKFEKIGKYAMFGTGSAPGIICAATKHSMKYLDSCDTIYNFVWEGAIAKRFQPFWWSAVTALTDMSEMAIAYEDGQLKSTPAFGLEVVRKYDEMETPIIFREHCHDEPMQYSFNADTHFKGVKNAYFKYAGAGMDFAKPLYEAGLLSKEPEMFQGREIVPFEYIISHLPEAPKYEEDIKAILDEGMQLDSGCMVIESYGKKDGRDVLVEVHVNAPGVYESFERAKMTGEMYLTGQGGYLFTKLFVEDHMTQTGMLSSDMLTEEQVDKYFEYAAELGITLDTYVKEI